MNPRAVSSSTTASSSALPEKRRSSAPLRKDLLIPRPDQVENQNFEWYEERPISALARISPLYTFKKSFWMLLGAMSIIGVVVSRYNVETMLTPSSDLASLELLIARFAVLSALLVVGYWEAARRSIEIKVNGFRLEVTKGVFWKVHASTHLLPHTSIHIERTGWFDILFNMATLQILPVTTPDPELVSIPALPVARAHQLKSYLTQQMDKQVGISSTSPARALDPLLHKLSREVPSRG